MSCLAVARAGCVRLAGTFVGGQDLQRHALRGIHMYAVTRVCFYRLSRKQAWNVWLVNLRPREALVWRSCSDMTIHSEWVGEQHLGLVYCVTLLSFMSSIVLE